ncbi:PDCD5-related protein [Trinorchestia longiramus]|nr:PDCD5-related protein [Trinorchestia longiramus]
MPSSKFCSVCGQAQQEQQEQQEAAKKSIVGQALSQEAAARLNTIRLAKPDKGKQLEAYIVNLATSGRMMGKMTEPELISIVEELNKHTSKSTKVKFDRRRAALDSDSD